MSQSLNAFPINLNNYLLTHRSNSPESGISTSHLSIPDAEFADADGEFEDPLPALGTAKAVYSFEGQNCNNFKFILHIIYSFLLQYNLLL